MNFERKFAVFALNLMTWFQERVKLLVTPFLELLNILVLEHKACLSLSTCFLDINITCQNNQLKTSVYRKPTFSGVFTHYESYIDQSYKKLLIFTLLSRCYFICSDDTLFHLKLNN